MPFSQARSINLSPWDIYTEANIGFAGSQNVNNVFAIGDAAQGFEISGGHQYGGYHYSLAIVNQNTSGTTTPAPNVGARWRSSPTLTTKDIYARFSYRFNLEERSGEPSTVRRRSGGPRDHTSLSLGDVLFQGPICAAYSTESIRLTTGVLTAREPFYRVGGDFSFNYRAFNLFGLYMYGHDDNLLLNHPPANPHLALDQPPKFNGGFLS